MDLDTPKPETPTVDTKIAPTPLETQEVMATQEVKNEVIEVGDTKEVGEVIELEGAKAGSSPTASPEPKPSYVKLAMRNMVRKRGTSLQHFFLTTLGLLGVLVGLAYLTR
jgi:hypothetical protein